MSFAEAKAKNIKSIFDECMKKIMDNYNNGRSETELFIEKEYASEVKGMISEAVEKVSPHFSWMTVRTATNPYTGRYENFSGEVIGNQMRYKLKYFGE